MKMLVERKKTFLVFIKFLKTACKEVLVFSEFFQICGSNFPLELTNLGGCDQITFPQIPRMRFSTWLGTPSFLSLAR